MSTASQAIAPAAPGRFPDTLYSSSGWAGDDHPDVIRFIRQVTACRDSYDLDREKCVLDNALSRHKGKKPYGRICEEACWFYLRQQGIRGEPRILDGDEKSSKTRIYQAATNWLSLALSCYLQIPIRKNIKPAELRELIENHYRLEPDSKRSDEFRKRLRSVCASFGHIHEKLAGRFSEGQSDHHSDLSHQFYELKKLADPYYESVAHQAYEPKINIVEQLR